MVTKAMKSAGCPECPYCRGEGVVPTTEVMKRVQALLLENGFKRGALTRLAGVDPSTWARGVTIRKDIPAWRSFWGTLVRSAIDAVGLETVEKTIEGEE